MAYQPRFTITAHLLAITEEIAAFREKILAATVQVPWIPTLQKDARVRNTHSSTAIEGNPLTLEQVRLLEEGQPLPTEPQRAKREVLNYLAGLRFIEQRAKKKTITHEDVLKLHAIIASDVMDQGQAGRYRDIRVRVGKYLPPAPEMVSGLMADCWSGGIPSPHNGLRSSHRPSFTISLRPFIPSPTEMGAPAGRWRSGNCTGEGLTPIISFQWTRFIGKIAPAITPRWMP
jgi:hypothetical protein